MKDDKWISSIICAICMIIVVATFFYPAIVQEVYCKPSQDVAAVTPTAEPTPTTEPSPTPSVTAESTPILTPLPSTTPIPHIVLNECLIVDSNAFYSEVLNSLYDQVSDVVCLQIESSDGQCYFMVLAKLNGKWQIMETSQG